MKLKALKRREWCLQDRLGMGGGRVPSKVTCPHCGKRFKPWTGRSDGETFYGVPAHKKEVKVQRPSNGRVKQHRKVRVFR